MLPQVGTEGARFCVTQELAGRLRAPSVVTPKLPGAQGPARHHFPKLCHLGGRGKMPCGQKRVKVEVETEISTPFISLCKSLARRAKKARHIASSGNTTLGSDPSPRQALACRPCFLLFYVFTWSLGGKQS